MRLSSSTLVLVHVAFIAAMATGQPVTPLKRLAVPVSMSGVILDSSGHAVADVEIYEGRAARSGVAQWGKARWEIVRGEQEGRFSIRTDAPFIVFRKAGFESQRVRCINRPDKTVITLVPASRRLPVRPANSDCAGLPRSAFCFPNVAGIRVGNPYSTGDSTARDFSSFRNKDATLKHDCCGWVTTDGLPALSYMWQSVLYKETVYEVGGLLILDAKGMSSSGKMWHFLGRDGEYAGYNDYRGLDPKDAALLDKLVDGVCIRNRVR
jgi:hypothetical protein